MRMKDPIEYELEGEQQLIENGREQEKKYSFAISMTNAGLLHPPYLIDSNFDDDRFLEYVEDELAPKLGEWDDSILGSIGEIRAIKEPNSSTFQPTSQKIDSREKLQITLPSPLWKPI